MRQLKNKGFTLIEILVVIGIIGVLSSIGMNFMKEARRKAYDAETIAQLSMARNAAQLYYEGNNYSYANSNGGSVANNCNAPHSMFIDMNSGMFKYASEASYPPNTDLRCSSNDNAYAISASLSTSGEYWCVNHQGYSKKITATSHIAAHPNNDTDCTP